MSSSTCNSDLAAPLKTLAFRCFQRDQDTSSKSESKIGLEALSIRRRCSVQNTATSTSQVGSSASSPSLLKRLNQTCLEKTQPRKRCEAVSTAWAQKTQESSSCSLCRFRRSAVQILERSTSQKNIFTLGGALVLQSSFAPSSSVDPAKKTR